MFRYMLTFKKPLRKGYFKTFKKKTKKLKDTENVNI